jgi:hypothetical protein
MWREREHCHLLMTDKPMSRTIIKLQKSAKVPITPKGLSVDIDHITGPILLNLINLIPQYFRILRVCSLWSLYTIYQAKINVTNLGICFGMVGACLPGTGLALRLAHVP